METITYTQNAIVNRISLVREPSLIEMHKISSSRDINSFCRQLYNDSLTIFESFYVVLLNNSNMTIGYAEISKGGITGTIVDVRLILKYVFDSLAVGVILVHNHPSGTLQASNADKQVTQKVKNALNLIDVKLLDHIILTNDSYLSFADENIL